MELLDLYDRNKQTTGEIIIRNATIPKDKYYLVVLCFIRNNKNEYLMQKRSPEKGGEWATTGGHPVAGENSLNGMLREVKEEIGLTFKKEDLTLFRTIKGRNRFCDLYAIDADVDLKEIVMQKEEVSDVKWMTEEEINKLHDDNHFKNGHYFMFTKYINYIKKSNR